MKWLRRLFPEKRTAFDPAFGRITYDREQWTAIPIDTSDVMIIVTADANGPSDAQRLLFTAVKKELSSLSEEARNYIAVQRPKNGLPVDIPTLTPYAVIIGDDTDTEKLEFTLELSDKDASLIQCVLFRDWLPVLCWEED